MYVTSLPGRIVGAGKKAVAVSGLLLVGDDGLSTRIYAGAEGLVVTERDSADKTSGYVLKEGQILDFSGTAQLYNPTEKEITVYILTFDTV
ncbi:MAG: hypothetical protein IKV97_04940 [Clostridia bacterium]|nr:hypothetical protein [Clostridia bacterium]